MLNLTQYFIPGPQGTLALKAGTNFSYKGDHLQVYTNTEIDRWFVGAFTSANYFITVEFDSNQKESLQVMVVARPDHASFTVYGRTSVDDQLITVTAEVTNSWLSLKASPANAAYAGSRISLFATYSETMLPLKRPTVVGSFAPGGGGSGGTAPPPLPGGTTGSGVSVQVSDTAPSVTETGSLWFNSNTGELFVYYKDGTSDQWVQPASAGGVSGGSGVSQAYVDLSINTVIDSAPLALNTLGKIAGALNNDPLFLTTLNSTVAGKAPTASPIFTGTVSGITAAMVGLGNVTNESKATMFNNPVFTGTVTGITAGGTYTLPASNTTTLGGVIIPVVATSGLVNTSGSITLATATTTQLGGVIIPVVATSGLVNTSGSITLATATTTQLGGVVVPAVATSGLVNTSGSITLATATTTQLGGVKIDGTTVTINGSGVISASATSITTYPAITRLDVTAPSSAAYLFNNQYSGNNPTIYAISGATIAFNLNVTGHPFLIQTSAGTNYNTGLIHVAVDGTVSTGSNAQGKVTGTLYWQIPADVNGAYRYSCSIHTGSMVGVITINNAGLASRGTVAGTTASLANNATGNLTIVGFKGYVLYKIQTSAGAWVRMYTDSASRTADSSRLQTSDPTPGSGVIAEVITSGAQTIIIGPGTIGFNNESTPTTNIELAVTNLSGSTTTIVVTLTILKIEA